MNDFDRFWIIHPDWWEMRGKIDSLIVFLAECDLVLMRLEVEMNNKFNFDFFINQISLVCPCLTNKTQ